MNKEKKLVNTICEGVIFMKMKKAYIYLISFFSLTIMFTICYYISYKSALHQFNNNSVEKNNTYQNINVANNSGDKGKLGLYDDMNDAIMAVENANSLTIKPTATYILQTYDIKEDILEENKQNAPEFLVGLTRNQVIAYLNQYMSNVPLEDYEKGLVSFELLSFSSDKVVLKKSYNSDNIQYKYYLAVQNGVITVYYSDKKTVYEYTDVYVADLTEEEQIELSQGKYVKDLDELYGLLENYTS